MSYVASVYKAFTNDLNLTVVYMITLKEKVITVSRHSKKLNVRLKLPPTMLHSKHKVKRGLTTVVALATVIYFKFKQRQLCVQVYKD